MIQGIFHGLMYILNGILNLSSFHCLLYGSYVKAQQVLRRRGGGRGSRGCMCPPNIFKIIKSCK